MQHTAVASRPVVYSSAKKIMAARAAAVSTTVTSTVTTLRTTATASSTSAEANSGSTFSRTSTVSLLQRMRAPKRSDLTRKRAVDHNPPLKGKRRCRGAKQTDPKSVPAKQRISEFPNENLTVSNNKLFCKACREELSLKKNVIANHVRSSKHKAGKIKLVSKGAKEKDIADALKATDGQCHPVGETLPLDHRIYHVKVVKTFIRAAVPLNKLSIFRDLLEESAYSLTDRRHMSDLVSYVLSQEVIQIKEEIAGHPLSVIFDGITRLGEAIAIVVRYVDSELNIQQ